MYCPLFLCFTHKRMRRGAGAGGCSPPNWTEIRFTRTDFLKEQYEIRSTFLPALQLYLIFRAENLQPPPLN